MSACLTSLCLQVCFLAPMAPVTTLGQLGFTDTARRQAVLSLLHGRLVSKPNGRTKCPPLPPLIAARLQGLRVIDRGEDRFPVAAAEAAERGSPGSGGSSSAEVNMKAGGEGGSHSGSSRSPHWAMASGTASTRSSTLSHAGAHRSGCARRETPA